MIQDLLFGFLICWFSIAMLGSLYHWVMYLTSALGSWLLPTMSTRSQEYTASISKSKLPISPPAACLVLLFVMMILFNVILIMVKGKEINIEADGVVSNTLFFMMVWLLLMLMHIIWIKDSFDWKRNLQLMNHYFSLSKTQENYQYLHRGFSLFCYALLPVFILMLSTVALRDKSKLNPMLKVINQETEWSTIAWVYLGAVVAAPLAEELIFRFCLQTLLSKKLGALSAIITTAMLFSIVHGWPDAIPLIPLALILGYHMYHTGEYLTVVFTHAIFNCFMLTNFVILTYVEI